jgi:hypothetical protein
MPQNRIAYLVAVLLLWIHLPVLGPAKANGASLPQVSKLTLSPAAVLGGQSATGTVTLSGSAPTGGLSVTLASANEAVLVPSSITVASGKTTATFTATTVGVIALTRVTVTATLNVSVGATLTINPATVASVTFSPSSVAGGGSSTGKVTLNGPAAYRGTAVSLTSGNALVSVPASVLVTYNNTSVSFTASTSSPVSTTVVSVTATGGGGTQTGTLTVNPASSDYVSHLSFNPATVIAGQSSTGTVMLNQAAPVGGAVVTLHSGSVGVSVPASVTVAGGQTSVAFTATTTANSSPGTYSMTATLNGMATANLAVNSLVVSGLAFNPGAVTSGQMSTATVTLNGGAPAGGLAVTLKSSNASVVAVPVRVTVPAGMKTQTFHVTGGTVASTTAVMVTASTGATSVMGILDVNPLGSGTVSSLNLSQPTANPGDVLSGTVTLAAVAKVNTVVALASSVPTAASVPRTVTVTVGSTSVTFAVSANLVSVATPVSITASIGASMKTAPLTVNPGNPPVAIDLTVNPSTTAQTWEAWRATATGPTFPQGTVSQATLNQLITAIDDLGITGFRLQVQASNLVPRSYGGGSFSNLAATVPAVVLPLKTLVEGRGEPFSTYVSLIADQTNFTAAFPGGVSDYRTYVDAFENFSQANFGFHPTYWAVFNEPTNAPSGFGSSSAFGPYVDATADELRIKGFPTKVQTVETITAQSGFLSQVLSHVRTSALPEVGLYSFHGYDEQPPGPPNFTERHNIRNMAIAAGVHTAMTEICCRTGWNSGNYVTAALDMSRDIYWNLNEANVSIWEPLAAMYTCNGTGPGCPPGGLSPIMIDPNLTKFYLRAPYYALRQYAHYIRPAYVRVDVSCTVISACPDAMLGGVNVGQNIKPVAFSSPAGKYVLVVINDQTQEQTISIARLPSGTYAATGIDPNSFDPTQPTARTYPAQTISAGQSLQLLFPAQAIVTIVQQ